jgi:hypothetical protein
VLLSGPASGDWGAASSCTNPGLQPAHPPPAVVLGDDLKCDTPNPAAHVFDLRGVFQTPVHDQKYPLCHVFGVNVGHTAPAREAVDALKLLVVELPPRTVAFCNRVRAQRRRGRGGCDPKHRPPLI